MLRQSLRKEHEKSKHCVNTRTYLVHADQVSCHRELWTVGIYTPSFLQEVADGAGTVQNYKGITENLYINDISCITRYGCRRKKKRSSSPYTCFHDMNTSVSNLRGIFSKLPIIQSLLGPGGRGSSARERIVSNIPASTAHATRMVSR